MKWWALGLLITWGFVMAVIGGAILYSLVAAMKQRCALCGATAKRRDCGIWLCKHHLAERIEESRRDYGS